MGVYNVYQDFADRHFKWFGGRKHFGYLVKMAMQFGVARCDELASAMKHEKDIKKEERIKYFHACLQDIAQKKRHAHANTSH